MRSNFYSKAFFLCSLVLVIIFFIYLTVTPKLSDDFSAVQELSDIDGLKYILEWTSPKTEPFVFLGKGRNGFKRRNCKYTNCFVTSERSYLPDITKFDVVLFHGPEINNKAIKFPNIRSPHQKYVYASMESSQYYPVCSKKLNNFFNWTWTFRLDSDSRWGYMIVKNASGNVVGPNKEMHWMKLEDMDPVDIAIKNKLKSKRKAAAWFVSNCKDLSGRKKFADKLKKELEKYNLDLDIYGACGSFSCPVRDQKQCHEKIKELYYFYLAFENSFSEDYVTEKLLHALKNDAVPIVYGGANYSRFMPDGIYLNARELGVEKLAAKMNELIVNPEEYVQYFRCKNHYSFHSMEEDNEHKKYCDFCALLNDQERMKEITVIDNFQGWWDNPNFCK